jgi:hypothetical protein
MWHAEVRPLVEDSALPGTALVLDPDRLQTWLSDSLGEPCSVHLRRLRYKPGTSVVVAFDLTTRHDGVPVTEPCLASAYAPHAEAKLTKTLRLIPPSACLAHDTRARALVTTAAGDRALPLLPRLGGPDGIDHLLERMLPDSPRPDHPDAVRIRTVRHNPGRRWVGILEREQHEPLLLRAFRGGGRMDRAASCYSTLARRSSVPTPRVIGKSRSLAVLAVSWAEGHDLASSGNPNQWTAAGRALARLHGTTSSRLKLTASDPGSDATAVRLAGRQVAQLLPDLAGLVQDLAGTTARLLEHLPRDRAALHGDFSADQVVIGSDGVPHLIDLDSACWGASAADLGCLTASTMTSAEALGMGRRGERDVAALVGGYEQVRRAPDPVTTNVHTVAYRLRKAADPFRDCHPEWREQVRSRVAGAQGSFESLYAGARR